MKPYDAAELSHEIRTALNSICGNLNILQMEESCPGSRYLENAVLAAEYLQRLVNSVLNISERENKTEKHTKLTSVTLEELVRYPQGILEFAAAKKKIQMRFLLDTPVYQYLYLDVESVWQILINLLSNAIKYTDDGGTVCCRLSETYLEEKRVKLLIEIEDTGIGMEEEFLSEIGKAYVREGRSREAFGSGLGLALTGRLITLLQGTFTIQSKAGVGTTVAVELEADADDMRYDFSADKETQGCGGKKDEKKLSIKRALVAEDEAGNMEVICRYLQELGIAADKAYDGRAAVELFEKSRENEYDVIFMDMNMPGMDGLEAALTIKGMERADRNLPMIAMTADLTLQEEKEVISAGMSVCLKKPYCLEDVRNALLNY